MRQTIPRRKKCLRRKRDVGFSERVCAKKVIVTVSLVALLQYFVQSSFNGTTFYAGYRGFQAKIIIGSLELPMCPLVCCSSCWPSSFTPNQLLVWSQRWHAYCPSLDFASSVAAIFAKKWVALCLIRILNGLGEHF